VVVSFGGTDYAGTFENAQVVVPEPAGLGLIGLALLAVRRKRRS
jgi:MYXO-CTERM domain-containing protein